MRRADVARRQEVRRLPVARPEPQPGRCRPPCTCSAPLARTGCSPHSIRAPRDAHLDVRCGGGARRSGSPRPPTPSRDDELHLHAARGRREQRPGWGASADPAADPVRQRLRHDLVLSGVHALDQHVEIPRDRRRREHGLALAPRPAVHALPLRTRASPSLTGWRSTNSLSTSCGPRAQSVSNTSRASCCRSRSRGAGARVRHLPCVPGLARHRAHHVRRRVPHRRGAGDGSLWPSILVHVLTALHAGDLARRGMFPATASPAPTVLRTGAPPGAARRQPSHRLEPSQRTRPPRAPRLARLPVLASQALRARLPVVDAMWVRGWRPGDRGSTTSAFVLWCVYAFNDNSFGAGLQAYVDQSIGAVRQRAGVAVRNARGIRDGRGVCVIGLVAGWPPFALVDPAGGVGSRRVRPTCASRAGRRSCCRRSPPRSRFAPPATPSAASSRRRVSIAFTFGARPRAHGLGRRPGSAWPGRRGPRSRRRRCWRRATPRRPFDAIPCSARAPCAGAPCWGSAGSLAWACPRRRLVVGRPPWRLCARRRLTERVPWRSSASRCIEALQFTSFAVARVRGRDAARPGAVRGRIDRAEEVLRTAQRAGRSPV